MAVNSQELMNRWWSGDMRLGAGHAVHGLYLSASLPHCHPQYTFHICLRGTNEFVCDGVHYVQNPGELIVHNSGQVHQSLYVPRDCSETLVLHVDPTFLLPLAQEQGVALGTPGRTLMFLAKHSIVNLLDLAEELVEELDHDRPGREMLLHSITVHILIRLLREVLTPTIVNTPPKEYPRLHTNEFSKATRYMEGRRFSNFSLAELCCILRTSQSRFIRLFRSCTGGTPNAYFTQLLMERAQMLLRIDKCTVKETGFELGFRNISYFCKLFRKAVGATPNVYKELAHIPKSIAGPLTIEPSGTPRLRLP